MTPEAMNRKLGTLEEIAADALEGSSMPADEELYFIQQVATILQSKQDEIDNLRTRAEQAERERDEALEALSECESWMRCECAHPVCKQCRASKEAREIISKHEKE